MKRLLLLAIILGTAPIRADQAVFPESLMDAAQDGAGCIWAARRNHKDELLFHNGSEWRVQPFVAAKNAGSQPLAFLSKRDGAVVCLWRGAEQNQYVLSRHTQGTSERWATFEGKRPWSEASAVAMAEDSMGNLWITEQGENIYRFAPDGSGGLAFTIPADAIFPAKNRPPTPLRIVEDPQGRIWIWPRSSSKQRGMVVYGQGKFEILDPVPELRSQSPYACVCVKDSATMWVAVTNQGLFEVDLNTMKGKFVEFPEGHHSIGSTSSIIEQNGAWYFLVHSPKLRWWRFCDGQWAPASEPLNVYGVVGAQSGAEPIRAMGVVLQGGRGSLFRFSDLEKPPEIFDWRSGFMIRQVEQLFALPDERVFARGRDGRFFLGKLETPPPAHSGRVRTFEDAHLWRAAPDGKIWATLERKTSMLSCWDGTVWREYPISIGIQAAYCSDLAFDSKGRIWFLPNSNEFSVGIFDPATSRWRVFEDIEAAISSGYVTFQGDLSPLRYYIAAWSPDRKRVAFRTMKDNQIAYYDGYEWKRILGKEISPEVKSPIGPPFFDSRNQLCVQVRDETWKLLPNGWARSPSESSAPLSGPAHKKASEKPPGEPLKSGETATQDNSGAWWILRTNGLWKLWLGKTIPVFDQGEVNPMGDGRRLESAFVDKNGNAFLQTNYGSVQIRPRSSLCDTVLQVENISPETVRVRLGSSPEKAAFYRWRIDTGDWSNAMENVIALKDLPPGKHIVRAVAVNAELFADESPAKVEFALNYNYEDRIRSLIEQLSDREFEQREAAIQALAKHGSEALPLLKKAAASASDPWWIAAAIQQIERSAKE